MFWYAYCSKKILGKMSTYLLVLVSSVFFPFLFSFHKRIQFNKKASNVFKSIFLCSVVFIFWDVIYTEMGVWGFSPKHHVDVLFAGLPLEEILFFYVIPFCCLFSYFVLKNSISIRPLKISVQIYMIVGFVFLMMSYLFMDKAYTLSVCIFMAVILFILAYKPQPWFSVFLFSFILISLGPFLLVNGVLTGLLDSVSPPVWYNDAENLGIRIMTIPIEDFFYSFSMLFTSTYIYEFFERKSSNI